LIWYSSLEPTESSDIRWFAVSDLTGLIGQTPKMGDLVFCNSSYYVVSRAESSSIFVGAPVSIRGTVDSALSATSENPVQNKEVKAALDGKLDINQGTANAGKFLVVGSDGNVTTVTMAAWQGGSY
jgi:hypothetical protein